MLKKMNVSFLYFFFFLLTPFSSDALPPQINVWPKPRIFRWAKPYHAIRVSPNISISSPPNRYLLRAVNRCIRQIQTEHYAPIIPPLVNISSSSPPLEFLLVSVDDTAAPLQDGVDESYTLSVLRAGARLQARTVWGAMRGLETFSQLIWGNPSRIPVGAYIWDAPLFRHRGILLDTSRNFYPVEDILRTIRAMSANKLNVFHWHITDAQSFPLVLPSEPELAEKGSYAADMRYSPADVSRIVKYGLEHGVRVLPEIDTPAHTGSWAGAYPEIVTCANMFWWPSSLPWADRLASEPGTGHLNPLNPKTYQVLRNVISDVSSMFPENFFHGGADEINPGCWKTDPSIQSYISQNGSSLTDLLKNFISKLHPIIVSQNKTAVFWEDVLLSTEVKVGTSSLPRDSTVIQTWQNGVHSTKRIASMGYRVIVSSSEYYYLDCGHGGFLGNDSDGVSWCEPFKTWQKIYDYDVTEGLTEEEARLVLGGEVALWSEQSDGAVVDGRIWPRAAAMAESMWSGNRDEEGRRRSAEATDRLNEWRYRMVERGIGAEPIQPLWCVKHPGMCNSAHSSLVMLA